MSYALPSLPMIWESTPRLMDFGGRLRPPLGGPEQRIQRLGSRWSVDLRIGALNATQAGALLGVIMKATTQGATVTTKWPQEAGSAHGTPKVNGGGQAGSSLVVDGLSADVIKAGTFFSMTISGRSYLHMVTDDVTPAAGAATLSIAPMLRASPADNADLDMATPTIEGFLSEEVLTWSVTMMMAASFTLSITECE